MCEVWVEIHLCLYVKDDCQSSFLRNPLLLDNFLQRIPILNFVLYHTHTQTYTHMYINTQTEGQTCFPQMAFFPLPETPSSCLEIAQYSACPQFQSASFVYLRTPLI
jgi:hypothetical protein